jgi:hypothetical protein
VEVGRLEAQTLRRERDIQEQKFAKRLGQTPTDSQGEFFLGYHTEEFADLFKANPALLLMVLDAPEGPFSYRSKRFTPSGGVWNSPRSA